MKKSKESNTVRQNGAYTTTRKAEVNLKRNPTLHFQIGLILTLLACIVFIEMRMPVKAQAQPTIEYNLENPEWAEVVVVEEPKQEIKQIIEQPPQQLEPDVFIIDDEPQKDLEDDLFPDTEPTDDPTVDNPPIEIDLGNLETPEPVDFYAVEEAPLFPGCSASSSKDERKQCMSDKIQRLVSKKFDADLGADLGLQGKHRVFVEFRVGSDGEITGIRTRGPHPALEREAERVVKLIPTMQPGKQRGVPVEVIYKLPITLRVD